MNSAAHKAAAKAMAPGFKAMATRMDNAEAAFVEVIMERGSLNREDATKAMRTLLKHKAAKLDAVNGVINVKHGMFLEADVLRNAVEMAA